MQRDEQAGGRPVNLEATVAKNLRWLRESHGLSREQLGSALALHGFDLHDTTVAQIEDGARPLRLNEVAALAAIFRVPVESLWEQRDATPGEPDCGGQDKRDAAAGAVDAEQQLADYYRQQRYERLRDK